MTEVLIRLWEHDPLLVVLMAVVVVLLIYIEILHLRIRLLESAAGPFGRIYDRSQRGQEDGGSGCASTLLWVVFLGVLIVAVAGYLD